MNQKPIIYNSDIKDAMNLMLLRQRPQETYIQQSCKTIFDGINNKKHKLEALEKEIGMKIVVGVK